MPVTGDFMLAEIRPFREPIANDTSADELIARVMPAASYDHPLASWLKTNPLDAPSLIFDLDTIEARMAAVEKVASAHAAEALIAVKSCPAPEYLRAGQKCLSGFDVSNLEEYQLLPGDLSGKLVSVTGPAISGTADAFRAKGNAAVLTLDSLAQIQQHFSSGSTVPYVLRIQGSDLLSDRNPPDPAYFPATRFGFTRQETLHLMQHASIRQRPPCGFHVHHGSERNQKSTYREIIHELSKLSRALGAPPRYINLGGGWHAMAENDMDDILREARAKFPQPTNILIEPGRLYGEDSGFATGVIVNQSEGRDGIRLTLNLSGRCHLHWSTARLLHTVKPKPRKLCRALFFGASCYEADTIGSYLLPFHNDFYGESGLSVGKHVVFSGISTYSAAWNTSFNGIAKANVIWWRRE